MIERQLRCLAAAARLRLSTGCAGLGAPLTPKKTRAPKFGGPGFFSGGVDGTRTRDPRRDRPVF